MEDVTVFVPAPGSDLRDEVAEGSAMVGSEVQGTDGRLRVDFEGDGELFPTFAARVRRATDRHRWKGPDGRQGYPTSACAYVSSEEVVAVGTYEPGVRRIEVTDEDALKEWLGVEVLGEEELGQ